MQRLTFVGKPSATFCFGRDELCDHIIRSALEQGAVLLFGGRQAGKTTVLLRIEENHRARPDVIPIYVDLMTLPPEAGPAEVFRLLSYLARQRCRERNPSLSPSGRSSEAIAQFMFDDLVSDLSTLLDAMTEPNLIFLFLIDEAKRMLRSSLSKGLQDNLFALLYGETTIAGRCCIVLAGAQDLYEFCENQTSPIGSRAASHMLTNLPTTEVSAMLKSLEIYRSGDLERVALLVQRLAGGHPGLTLRIAVRPESMAADRNYEDIVENEKSRHSGLLRIWASSLSSEARAVQDLLLAKVAVSIREIPSYLQQHRIDRFCSDRACEELQFVGIANRNLDVLSLSGDVYASYCKLFILPDAPTDEEQSTWSLIEDTEIALRKIVRKKYEAKWGTSIDDRVKKVVGPEAWLKIQENQGRGAKPYRYSEPLIADPLLDFMYFGQLAHLIVSREAWDLFRHLFRDQRQLQDIVADISPVRNDHAHFRRVPPRELVRCRLRCEDFLYLLEQDS
jgi:hypothetical protein